MRENLYLKVVCKNIFDINISLEKHKKILRKFQPAFREIAKKSEPGGKKNGFLIKNKQVYTAWF